MLPRNLRPIRLSPPHNVDQDKNTAQVQNLVQLLIGSYERDVIRPHVLRHFKDLLLATARHPAMLYYLDNWQSMSPADLQVGPFAPRRGNFNVTRTLTSVQRNARPGKESRASDNR